MELKLTDGNYLPRLGGGFVSVSGIDELAQRVEMKLKARRGGFPLMPDFGSRLYSLPSIKPSRRDAAARQFVAEALSDEPGLSLEELNISFKNDTMLLDLQFSYSDNTLSVSMSV